MQTGKGRKEGEIRASCLESHKNNDCRCLYADTLYGPVRLRKEDEVKVSTFVFVMLLLVEPICGQTDSKPYSRQAAEKSFRALVTAKDSDILDVIRGDGLVCFADSLPFHEEDRFLTIVLPKPSYWMQDTSSNVKANEEGGSFYDGKTEFPAISIAALDFHVWVNQDWTSVVDSMLEGKWHSYGHHQRLKNGTMVWKAFDDMPPVFRFAKDKDEISGSTDLSAMEDGSTFSASKKFRNRDNGTTSYEINVRLSTGRYKETWTPDKGEAFESVGNCYKAKEFVRSTTPAKKAK